MHPPGSAKVILSAFRANLVYDNAIELNPKDADIWRYKGDPFAEQGKYDEAIHAYSKATGLDPEDTLAWYNIGEALIKIGKYEEAI